MTSLSQEARVQRAAAEFDRYQFRSITLHTSAGDLPAVYVTTRQGVVYTVTFHPDHPRCCCPDYQQRCAGSLAKCKHVLMSEKFLASSGTRIPVTTPEAEAGPTGQDDAEELRTALAVVSRRLLHYELQALYGETIGRRGEDAAVAIWRAVQSGDPAEAEGLEEFSAADELAYLRQLSRYCGGWFRRNEEFVPLAEWQVYAAKHTQALKDRELWER
ncbi:MAG TPA: hypothetical protein VFU47_11145 [Armatimonadota bacterium]|nr:hypothetical protein [Armatimonadota bacterium]